MANKLFIMFGVLLLIKRDLFTFSSGAEAFHLKSWNEYTKKLCNHHFYRFHTPPGEAMFLIMAFLEQITYLRYRSSLCVNQRVRNQSNEFTENNFPIWIFKVQKSNKNKWQNECFQLWHTNNMIQMFYLRHNFTFFFLPKLRTCRRKHMWDTIS